MSNTIDLTVKVKVPKGLINNATMSIMRQYAERFLATAFKDGAAAADVPNLIREYRDAIHRDPGFQELIKYGFMIFQGYYSVFNSYNELINKLKNMSIENEVAVEKTLLEIKDKAVDLTKIKQSLEEAKKEIKSYMTTHPMTAVELDQMEQFMEQYRDISGLAA